MVTKMMATIVERCLLAAATVSFADLSPATMATSTIPTWPGRCEPPGVVMACPCRDENRDDGNRHSGDGCPMHTS